MGRQGPNPRSLVFTVYLHIFLLYLTNIASYFSCAFNLIFSLHHVYHITIIQYYGNIWFSVKQFSLKTQLKCINQKDMICLIIT